MQGCVRFFTSNKWGFIDYRMNDEAKEIFFHIAQIQVAEDGFKYDPVAGCLVDFVIDSRTRREGRCEEARFIRIVEWPSK